jgi:hypothetical protein
MSIRCRGQQRVANRTRGEIGNLSIKHLSLLTPTAFGGCQFSFWGLRGRLMVALRYLEVVESPLEILDSIDNLRMRNKLTRIPPSAA